MKKFKSYNVTPSDVKKKWFIIDAEGKPVGRVAERAAYVLRGKHKAIYTPYLDTGDNVVIINAGKSIMTGNKPEGKIYYRHSGFPGGLTATPFFKVMAKKPCLPIEKAIKGMLPHGPLGRELFRNVRVYEGSEYLEVSQKPETLEVK